MVISAQVIFMNVKSFVERWTGRGYERGEAQDFWRQFLRDVLNYSGKDDVIKFEMPVSSGFIDAYLKDTRVIIEQKSLNVKLDDAVYQQAKKYDNALNLPRKARWIVTCNFQEFQIYNMSTLEPPTKILLSDLPDKFHSFDFLIKKRDFVKEKNLSAKAGQVIQKFYLKLKKQYYDPYSRETFESLNKLCVRLVFCLYAESADVFKEHKMFTEYLCKFKNDRLSFRSALIELFKTLNTPLEKRSPYLGDDLKNFPYVDGGLFDKELDFPETTYELREILFNELCNLRWQDISPTIFGAVFEATLHPSKDKKLTDKTQDIRREGGIHYTAPENIHKVIEPLFIDDLQKKFEACNTREDLFALQEEISRYKIFDPACGSGNFLTESYLSLRELENSILEVLVADGVKFTENPIKVSIENFYGIEINGFAVAVAKTALWISEIQMRQKTAAIIGKDLSHFPIKTHPHIHEGNALTTDWSKIIAPQNLNFIISNPPFSGKSTMTAEQKSDVQNTFKGWKGIGSLDYVACWFKKAADFLNGTQIRCAFVSTNSVCQGESIAALWKKIFAQGVHFDFAWRTFKWNSESELKAQVHVVIIGFSRVDGLRKIIFDGKEIIPAENINAYLLNAANVFVEKRSAPICNAPPMRQGNRPADGGNLIIKAEDYEEFIRREPRAKKYIRPYIGSEEFINGKERYCLWLVDCPPNELRKMPLVYERVKAVRDFRLKSVAASTRADAEKPALFQAIIQPTTDYLFVPSVSSERRKYVPIGFMNKNIIISNLAFAVPDATIYHFGVLISSVHMAWLKTVCGRLEMRYRYSATIVYNNFVWCEPTPEQRARIEMTAQGILDVLKRYPDSTLADLYDPVAMPADLRKAHELNDKAVMAAYGFRADFTEAEIISKLFSMYESLTQLPPPEI